MYYRLYNLVHGNRKKGQLQKWEGNPKLRRTIIEDYGNGNKLVFGKQAFLENCHIIVTGDNCKVSIGDLSHLIDCTIVCEDTGNTVEIGKNVIIAGTTQLACTEGKKISIGDDCLFADEIVVRTGDSHSVLNEHGSRTNSGKSVVVSKHTWVCERVILLKGSEIGEDSVVSAGSIVTGKKFEKNSIIAGNPARVIKRDINWDFKRI